MNITLKEFERLNSEDKDSALKNLALEKAATVYQEGQVVRIPLGGCMDIGVYFLSDEASKNVIPARHRTDTVCARRILNKGFEGNTDYRTLENYFHKQDFTSRDVYYAKRRAHITGNAIIYALQQRIAQQGLSASDIDSAVRDIIIENENSEERLSAPLSSERPLPREVAPYIQGQTLELLLPLSMFQENVNGRMVNGVMKGYEIVCLGRVPAEHIVHVCDPFELGIGGDFSVYNEKIQ